MSRRRRDGFWITTDEATSERLRNVRQKDTKPELIVRRILWRLGARFRVENRDLPGSPDIANRSRRWAIFVHGCYWHRHPGCRAATTPKRNRAFWEAKFAKNVERDGRKVAELQARGYEVKVIWECSTKGPLAELEQSLASWRPLRSGGVR